MAQHERGRLGGSSTHSASADHGLFFFLTSTLLPITPPRIPPTAAPMTPPLTLLRLVVAPMIAPAAAPIAASRCVCFTTCPPLDVTAPPLEYTRPPLLPLDRRVVVRAGVLCAGRGAAVVPFNAFAAGDRSAADKLSSEWFCCAANERSVLSDVSAARLLFRPHAPVATNKPSASANVLFFIWFLLPRGDDPPFKGQASCHGSGLWGVLPQRPSHCTQAQLDALIDEARDDRHSFFERRFIDAFRATANRALDLFAKDAPFAPQRVRGPTQARALRAVTLGDQSLN